jgi:hypothetical protein
MPIATRHVELDLVQCRFWYRHRRFEAIDAQAPYSACRHIREYDDASIVHHRDQLRDEAVA